MNVQTEENSYWKHWATSPDLSSDDSFHEATGEIGDVFLLHPFMLHSASRNLRRDVRIILNPPVALKEPFNFNRADGQYSLLEQKTLMDLGRPTGIPEWKVTGSRELVTPKRIEVGLTIFTVYRMVITLFYRYKQTWPERSWNGWNKQVSQSPSWTGSNE